MFPRKKKLSILSEQETRLKGKKDKKKKAIREREKGASFFVGWSFLVFSVCFGVYNNLTSQDTHTIHETKVIDKQLKDMTGIESYVKNFAFLYFTVSLESDQQINRSKAVESYLADGLQMDNEIDKDIETNVKVKNVSIWAIEEHESKNIHLWLCFMSY
ncbi:conjugal transfer protein [Enterococcus faecium]